jgi:UDP-GlcNAc:undecaprenyl-phosphate/decaprenyl-phosphate GlcNAc-1-phosphate transferase
MNAARPTLPPASSPLDNAIAPGGAVVSAHVCGKTLVSGALVTGAVATGTAAIAAAAARGAYAVLRRYPPAGEKTWSRTNHRGEPVTLLEGPAVTAGAVSAQVIGAVVAAGLAARPVRNPGQPERGRPFADPAALAGLGGLAFGVLDDLRGSGKRRGLRGHLGALAHGEVTTGAVKLGGLAATGLAAALLEGGGPADVAINAGLVAGGANLLNLFDLRPGRAIKVAAGSAGLIATVGALAGRDETGRAGGLAAVAAPVGAALALAGEDLGERAMLGDAGANALGAMLGAAAARALPRGARAGLLAGIITLTVASERVSFTRVIAATPPLHWLDMLGRRPAALPSPISIGPIPLGPVITGEDDDEQPPARWQVWRRRPGRHRRGAAREIRIRSGAWLAAWRRTRTPPEP